MAQELGISKAALAASLFKADPTSLPRTTVDDLFTLLGSAVTKCSRPNVQNCKAWIVANVVPSKNRSAALGRYLVALSRSLDNKEKPSVRRRRLHLLYVINDVLHHVKTNLGDASFGDALEAHLPVLVATVAEFKDCPKHMKKLSLLLDIWENKAYVSAAHLATLRKAAASDPSTAVPAAEAQSVTSSLRISKEAPYTLPSYHGDPSTPWYDLPAATWLPHITPNSTRPMLPDLIKPIQLAPGPADPKLVTAVKDLLRDVELLFSKERKADEEPYGQINELGEQVYLDEVTGDVIGGRTYYGWSRTFCEKMKERQKTARNGKHRGRSRSLSSSDSRDLSRSLSGTPAFKRRRRSPDSRSPSPRGRSRSSLYDGNRGRRGSSSGRSRSRSPYLRRPYSRSPSRSRSRSPGRSRLGSQVPPPPPRSQQHQQAPPPPPPLNQMGLPSGNLPPPPRPPGWNGPWPPPAPSPNATPGGWMPGMMIPPNMMAPSAWSGGPPPPPPPQLQNDPQSHYYQGGYGQRGHQDRHHWQHPGQGRGYGRGGGSWGRGRGRG